MSYERDNIRRMSGYTPGEQPDNLQAVKLNTNENPYPPPEPVLASLQAITGEHLRRYPPPTSAALREAAAALHNVTAQNIVTTNGGDELLRLAITTFVEPGEPIGIAHPSYSLYPVLAAINGSPIVRVPLDEAWRPPSDFATQLNRAGVNLTFLVNPHAPSGTLLDVETISSIARALQGVLLVDEAYVDFVDPACGHDLIALIHEHDNLLVLRTFSKGYSLAGLRLGYGIGAAGLIDPIATKTRDSYNLDVIAQYVGLAALAHREYAAQTWEAVRGERARLAATLDKLGLACVPSESNFLLARVPDTLGGGASALYQALKARAIFVRHFDQPRLDDQLRITVGTPPENETLLDALHDLLDR
ncbi:histidinol-phosphate transaminase [Nitrococcus mobilis]|uniref:Histidinol-phosphate aminotransferase n=1 Tax=Nitrococcus mobilis Nb-231 TaxID=314278 RepID=A4BVD2_9GAMM|nr:histidinol-phosphate transaminase [Nitrococcus mobilis]EAR20317.1 histidinol phosphate aminotransferase [Nitrococcus mobilis Nb-231]